MSTWNSAAQRVVSILDAVSQPAAPYYERYVKAAILDILAPLNEDPRVRISGDRYGNLIACYRHPDARFDASLAAAAHMDHPGFHITAVEGATATASIQGGLPRDERLPGSAMQLFCGDRRNHGVIREFTSDDRDTVTVDLDEPWEFNENGGYLQARDHGWAVPDVERFREDGALIHGRAMDDLAGCAMQIAALEIIVQEGLPVEFTAVFNRAEEVGFIGAVGACELGSIPVRAIVLCLEASKNLEGARPGDGIIIRTGDRQALFDTAVTEQLDRAAESAAAQGIRAQKRRMDGGTCEAALYMAYGYETGALAVPLINYHNQGESAVAAEAIHRDDLVGGVVMLVETARRIIEEERTPRALFREQRKAWFYRKAGPFLSAEGK
ncbi:MAG TPA: M20/M25/M40 family metallo-hydrolase [bacterium]|nr:M20/M25/M40 family metallo-hydrolase [bacterium]